MSPQVTGIPIGHGSAVRCQILSEVGRETLLAYLTSGANDVTLRAISPQRRFM